MKRKVLTVIMAIAMVVSLASCTKTAESSKNTEATNVSETVSSAKVESTTPTIDAIKASGKLRMATGTYVPFEYRDADNKIVGFDVDLGQLIADKLGVELEVMDMPFTSIIPSVEKGEYDLAIAAMYDKPARREVVLMSDSYMKTGMVLVTLKGNEHNIKSLADCDGLKVGVKAGATSQVVAEDAMKNSDVKYDIVGYEDTIGCVSDLIAGRVDVVVNDLLNQKEINKTNDKVEIVSDPFTNADLSIAVAKGNDNLMDFVNTIIADYQQDGTYDKLFDKWIN
ncbi:MAG: substrate-binding periplasmic protein [Sphaerochaeta sp.]